MTTMTMIELEQYLKENQTDYRRRGRNFAAMIYEDAETA